METTRTTDAASRDAAGREPVGSGTSDLLDTVARRLGAKRWTVCWREQGTWQVRSSNPSLRDDVLLRHAGEVVADPRSRALHVPVGQLGDAGARLRAAGIERMALVVGKGAAVYFEDPDTPAADRFAADPGALADLDFAGMLRTERTAAELTALADWVGALDDVAHGRTTPAAAVSRLGLLIGADLTLDDHTVTATEGGRAVPTRVLLRTASGMLRIAVSGSKGAEQDRRDALLRERARIGSAIHEGITQVLTNVAIQLEVVDQLLDDPQQARDMVRTSRSAVLEALDSLRSVIFDLTPHTEEWIDLVSGIRRFVEDFSSQWGVDTELEVEGPPRDVDAEVTSLAFAFVQEGLTNARKHSGAEAADVRLLFRPGRLLVEIVDEGVGVDPSAHEDRSLRQHQGLKIMESRVRLLDGRFGFESVPNEGSRLWMEVPA